MAFINCTLRMNQVYLERIKRTKGDDIDRHVHLEHGYGDSDRVHLGIKMLVKSEWKMASSLLHKEAYSEYGSWQVARIMG